MSLLFMDRTAAYMIPVSMLTDNDREQRVVHEQPAQVSAGPAVSLLLIKRSDEG